MQTFFVERAFAVFDRDGSGKISLAEFLDCMHRFSRWEDVRYFVICQLEINAIIPHLRHEPSEKLVFLFKIYDIDGRPSLLIRSGSTCVFLCLFSVLPDLPGDGRLQRREIESVMRACVLESGMELPESDVVALADALYDEALEADSENG